MVKLQPLICQQCGGAIDRNTMKCPYCETQYERKGDGVELRYVVEKPGIHTIRAMVKVDDMILNHSPERATKFVMDRMRHQIADGLLNYMKMVTEMEHSPMERCHIIRGEIRVVDPMFSDY